MEPYELLAHVVSVLERLQVRYFVTGSVASIAYGEPRLTNDIDIVVDLADDHVIPLAMAFPEPVFYASTDAMREAVRHRRQFNVIHPASGLKVDLIVRKDTEFDRNRFERSRRLRAAANCVADFASPEDVIIKKLQFYQEGGSEKHLRDITGMLKISGPEIDLDYIVRWADRLGVRPVWDAVVERWRGGAKPQRPAP